MRLHLIHWLGLESSQGSTEAAFEFIHVITGSPQLPAGCRSETSVPFHVDLSLQLHTTWQLDFPRMGHLIERELT